MTIFLSRARHRGTAVREISGFSQSINRAQVNSQGWTRGTAELDAASRRSAAVAYYSANVKFSAVTGLPAEIAVTIAPRARLAGDGERAGGWRPIKT